MEHARRSPCRARASGGPCQNLNLRPKGRCSMNADRWRKDKDPSRPTKQSLFYRLVSPGKHTESRQTDRPRRPEPEKRVLLGLCENQPQPLATAPVRLAGSCLAHRAQQTAKVAFRNVRAHPHQRPANLDLNSPRLCRTRLHWRLALDPLRPQSSSATPREKLRRRDFQRKRLADPLLLKFC